VRGVRHIAQRARRRARVFQGAAGRRVQVLRCGCVAPSRLVLCQRQRARAGRKRPSGGRPLRERLVTGRQPAAPRAAVAHGVLALQRSARLMRAAHRLRRRRGQPAFCVRRAVCPARRGAGAVSRQSQRTGVFAARSAWQRLGSPKTMLTAAFAPFQALSCSLCNSPSFTHPSAVVAPVRSGWPATCASRPAFGSMACQVSESVDTVVAAKAATLPLALGRCTRQPRGAVALKLCCCFMHCQVLCSQSELDLQRAQCI